MLLWRKSAKVPENQDERACPPEKRARTMPGTAVESFPPLQGAIAQAESWKQYLMSQQDRLSQRTPAEIAACLENIVWFGVKLGELLPLIWQLTFDRLFHPGAESWTTVGDFETTRQSVRHLFFTAREALAATRQVAERLQTLTHRTPAGIEQLHAVMEQARQLEETVFRDWPSFSAPPPPRSLADSLAADDSLAEALGIPVEEARQKLDARRRELKTKPE
jgi:hypothetical protein